MPSKLKDIIVLFILLGPSFVIFVYFINKGLHLVSVLLICLIPASIGITLLRIAWGDEKYNNLFFQGEKKKLEKFNNNILIFGIPISILMALIIGSL
ncbi:MAG: hypothetical protein A2464_05560 [Deltaproteobacteria bacterium RIFOXYC2_FULL_48_10]|nr:MAG: hypothetical protein A2464_05560 [Deltaproteobacteria bacterium RIFOXYC2_FULL_48_10]